MSEVPWGSGVRGEKVGKKPWSKDEILSYYREAECLFKFFGPQNSYLSLKEYHFEKESTSS